MLCHGGAGGRQRRLTVSDLGRLIRGGTTVLTVPGSFYEFISRDMVAAADGTRQLDLRFDSMNAEGIFKMTAAA
jgi:hypothetical protein